MLSDIEIANSCKMSDIGEIAAKLGLREDSLEKFGRYKAKVDLDKTDPKGKLILVTAINPTAAGEGKTTVSIGLADAMSSLHKKTCLALREPSLGPVFGVKGGAAGGGYSQVVPMEDINLHFTGDLHAITTANNLLCAMIDNHILRGNELDIQDVYFKRCMDMNDRALREYTIEGKAGGMKNCRDYERRDGFEITAASEVMAIVCLSKDLEDLKRRLGEIVVGTNSKGEYVRARDLRAEGAMAVLLKDAIKPNLVQTLEGTPAFVHGGPFANIAHGCNSIRATYAAMTLADYTVTEAGFGADLGAEKFLDMKCRVAGISPDCVVIVATVRALKLHGGADKKNLATEDVEAVKRGLPNLTKHIENMRAVYNLPVVVALNVFSTDSEAELSCVFEACEKEGVEAVKSEAFEKGSAGAVELAKAVLKKCDEKTSIIYSYDLADSYEKKIEDIAKKIYGADGADFSDEARAKIAELEKAGIEGLPVIIAKTQYSLSDDPKKLARPEGFRIFVRDIEYKGGAEFVVAVAGDIMLMPGLPKIPAAENIDIDGDGRVTGLF